MNEVTVQDCFAIDIYKYNIVTVDATLYTKVALNQGKSSELNYLLWWPFPSLAT